MRSNLEGITNTMNRTQQSWGITYTYTMTICLFIVFYEKFPAIVPTSETRVDRGTKIGERATSDPI